VEATEFPDLARKYQVNGVPKTVVNEAVDILGALPEEMYVEQVLSALQPPDPSRP
jgi:predicted DsbA family dithiol-disulfide isomerase